MAVRRTILLLLAAMACLSAETRVRIETERGNIVVALDDAHAPITVANFLRYVDAGKYNGGWFHRTVTLHPDNQPANQVKIEVIQAGPSTATSTGSAAATLFPPIPLERTSITGLKHLDGTISMARKGPDTAKADFFICIGAQPELDFGGKRNPDGQGFAAFGRVVSGMNVVRKIQQSPSKGQKLAPPVAIRRVARIR